MIVGVTKDKLGQVRENKQKRHKRMLYVKTMKDGDYFVIG
jgi:hypothetical protein